MPDLKEKLKEIPRQPGVYEFLNKDAEVIYVGKAKNLKNRVGQYLGGKDERPQLPYLMAEAADVRYTVVTNELESLFLENTLIKKYLPKYNILLRDDKNYAFITIDYRCQIPQIGYTRKFEAVANTTSPSLHEGTPPILGGDGPSSPPQRGGVASQTGRGGMKSKIRYFGPYSAAWKIRDTLNLVRRIFPYCSSREVGARPCFYYYLHRCPGVCIGKISLDEYCEQLDRICEFLGGHSGKIISELKTEMRSAAAERQFEKAARLRDQLRALEILKEKQNVILNKPVSWDIVSIAADSGYACINLFKVREGKMTDKENFIYEITDPNITPSSTLSSEPKGQPPLSKRGGDGPIPPLTIRGGEGVILQSFLERYYLETSDAPKVILAQGMEDGELISHIIRSRFNRRAEVAVPQKGKSAELVRMGITNAEEYLKHWLNSQAGHLDKIQNALRELKEQLRLEKIPERIECYDISNTQGTNPVGSMVVFKNGLPAKSEYRKFKIQGKKTPDDFAMMREMLTRRFARSFSPSLRGSPADKAGRGLELLLRDSDHPAPSDGAPLLEKEGRLRTWPLPDLIVIDGGKGQLSAAREVLQKFQIPNSKFQIPVIGLAKRIEEIFFPENPEPLVLPRDNPGLQLLQRLRDETHRFGITFHRNIRSKEAVKSALDDIPGIGPKTKKLLKRNFGTVANIKKMSLNDLKTVVGEKLAQAIKERL